MKIAISGRDKRMLILLAVFFLALGYYYLVLSPLQEMATESSRQLDSKRSALSLKQVKVRQFKTWQDYKKRLGGRVGRIYKMIEAPFAEKPVQDRIDAIMTAANAAGVKVENLKPVSVTIRGKDDKSKKVTDKFTIDGNCSFDAFLEFLRKLYGMKIDQFSLTAQDSNQQSLIFSLFVSSIPKVKLNIPELKTVKLNPKAFTMNHNIFTVKYNPAVMAKMKKLTPAEIEEERKVQLEARLNGLKLEGTLQVNKELFAVISDPQDKNANFHCYRVNDLVRGVRIEAIRENNIEFISKDKKTKCSITFSHASAKKTTAAPPKPKKAHFGLLVHVVDPLYAQKMKLSQKSGLLVLKSRPGVNVYKGDIITGIAGKKVLSIDDALNILKKYHAGDTAEIELIRKGKKLKTEYEFN